MTDKPPTLPSFTPDQITEIEQAFADYARRVEHDGEMFSLAMVILG